MSDKQQELLATIKREKLKLKGFQKSWEPFVSWIYKRRTGVSGMGSAYGDRFFICLKQIFFPKIFFFYFDSNSLSYF